MINQKNEAQRHLMQYKHLMGDMIRCLIGNIYLMIQILQVVTYFYTGYPVGKKPPDV